MRKKSIPFIALLVCLTLTASIVVIKGALPTFALDTAGAEATAAINAASKAFDAAEPIFERLRSSVADELGDNEDEESEDFSVEQIDTLTQELQGYVDQLDELKSGLTGFPDDMDTSVGKTVRATRDYLDMIRNMAADYAELCQYAANLIGAVTVLGNISGDANDYIELAESVYTTTNEALELMDTFQPPDYIAITHGDLLARLQEFQDFSVDFYKAAQMGDPLRTMSCVYRLNRISMMLGQWSENLMADLQLQFTQADHRINGSIIQLHDELKNNLALLKAA